MAHSAAADPESQGGAWVRATNTASERAGYERANTAFVFEGAPLRRIVAAAWGAHERDVHFSEGVDGEALYAAYASPPPGANAPLLPKAQAQLRARIRRTLGLDVRSETVEGPVQVLRRISSSAWQLPRSRHAETVVDARDGLFRSRGATMRAFTIFVRAYTSEPVIDETGLGETYDFVFEWDPEAERHAFVDAFGDIGLSLEAAERPHQRLVVRPAGEGGE